MKCGQEQPRCLRCQTAGAECVYNLHIKVVNYAPRQQRHETSIIRPPDPPDHGFDRRAKNSLQYFQLSILRGVPGHDFFESAVWHRNILPRLPYEPAIGGAAVALGAATQQADHPSGSDDPRHPWIWYGRAVAALNDYITRHGDRGCGLVLVACLLLLHFDFVQERHQQALVHLRGGLRVIQYLRTITPSWLPMRTYCP